MRQPAKLVLPLLTLALAAVAGAACVQENNTYPIDIFTEMHYSVSIRAQEPVRLGDVGRDPLSSPVLAAGLGDSDGVLVLDPLQIEYDAALAARLYDINCSACHGIAGAGDGPVASYITAPDSYWASENGTPYESPPNLLMSRETLTEDSVRGIIEGGVRVMPAFGNYLRQTDIEQLVDYIYDVQSGLGS